MEQRSLPKNVNVEDVCFSHLEDRARPLIIETNMPWWLAAVIATPFIVATVYGMHRYKLYKQMKK